MKAQKIFLLFILSLCMTAGIGVNIIYNADNRIRSATAGSDGINCIYDPEGRMIFKETTLGQTASTEKYILDIVGDYPVILVVIDATDSSVDKSYFYANSQTLMQQVGENRYFYLHDRMGSTRQVINASAAVVNSYTYDPWGNAFATEMSESVSNHYQFANYHWDSTIGMYYLNARWYDPAILRFTGRDPVNGKFNEPMTLHPYLYCLNNPINATDPSGEFLGMLFGSGWGSKMRASSMAMGGRAMAFAGRIYVAAYIRAVQINMLIYGISTGNNALSRLPITGYTRHGINSAISHDGVGVSPQAILNAVANPTQVIQQADGTFKYIGENAVVILNQFGQVITTWATSSNAWRQ